MAINLNHFSRGRFSTDSSMLMGVTWSRFRARTHAVPKNFNCVAAPGLCCAGLRFRYCS